MLGKFPMRGQRQRRWQEGLQIAHDGAAAFDAVIHLRHIAVHVHDRAVAFEGFGQCAGLTHIQAAAQHQQVIRFREGEIRPAVAVATDHPNPLRVLVRQRIHGQK